MVAYCSRECQIKDWRAGHKYQECEFYATSNERSFIHKKGDLQMTIRFVLKLKFEAGLLDKQFELFDGQKKRIEDLEFNTDCVKPDLLAWSEMGKEFARRGFIESNWEFIERFSQLSFTELAIGSTGKL